MPIEFLRPVGAAADVKELEYVSALLQTDMPDVRTDGSIRDVDIVRFLKSRYGIEVTASEVRGTVMFGLGGGDGDDECIDLMEMVAIILIPTLIKAAKALAGRPDGGPSRDDFVDDREYQSHQRRTSAARGLRPHEDLLRYVLDMINLDITGSARPKRLNRALLRHIFTSYGETELAEDRDLLNDMIAAARGGGDLGDDGALVLDERVFARALTGDVCLYDETNEIKVTTNYFDVFKAHECHGTREKLESYQLDEDLRHTQRSLDIFSSTKLLGEARLEMRPVRKAFNASAIDFTAGTYRSKMITVTLWAAFMLGYFGYMYGFATSNEYYSICPNESESRGQAFGCRFLVSTARWFVVFFIACISGLTFLGFGSVGNNIESESWWKPWVSIVAVLVQIIIPVYFLGRRGDISDKPEDRLLHTLCTILGFLVALLQFVTFAERCVPRAVGQVFVPSGIASEAAIKRAAAHKVNKMTQNALDLSTVKERNIVVDSHFGQALIAYSKLGAKFEPVGGPIWTWKRWWNGDLFTKEGIWFNARLLAGNAAMIAVAIFVLLKGIRLTKMAGEEFDKGEVPFVYDVVTNGILSAQMVVSNSVLEEATAKARDYFDHLAANCEVDIFSHDVQTLGFDTVDLQQVMKDALDAAAREAKEDFHPTERYMVVAPLAIGTCFAFLAAVGLIIIYIPSVTSTTLQLRSGVIPTFRDPQFSRHREDAELVTILLGSMFWGTLFSSVAVGGLIGALVFVLVWQVTEPYVLRYLAFLAGITVLVIFRVVLFYFVRTSFYDAFYRRRPALVNISALALEAGNFAISVGFIIVRVAKLLVTSALYIGRIDTPFLAPGVGNLWGNFELDNYPKIFIKDILAHEAHRHPYLETMGVMFMLKLRYGENFGKTAGSCWRLIFVFALMPWLSKYRIMTRPEKRDDTTAGSEPTFSNQERLNNSSLIAMDLAAASRNFPSFFRSTRLSMSSISMGEIEENRNGPFKDEKCRGLGSRTPDSKTHLRKRPQSP